MSNRMFTSPSTPMVVFETQKGNEFIHLHGASIVNKNPLFKHKLRYFKDSNRPFKIFIERDDKTVEVQGTYTYNSIVTYINTLE